MSTNWDWSSMWAAVKVAPLEQRVAIGQELDNVPGGFVGWLQSKSPKVQIEIMEGAPEAIQKNIYSEGALKPLTALALDIEPNALVVDKRKKR